ncbi:MAG: tetratricopeptide repeat protein [Prevotellaceae bacterium]|jgi:tetratricopeptide (TPR) repeat protein|nr:tetratricopeptide repeat protein [Prevotellaceae bacterium]
MKKLQFLLPIVLLATGLQAQTLEEGRNLYNEEQYEAAKQVLTQVNQQKPSAEAYYYLGEMALREKQFSVAENAFNEGLKTDPKYLYNNSGLGALALELGDRARADENFEKVRKGAKKDMKLLLSVAEAAMNASKPDLELAKSYITIAEETNNKSPYLYLVRGDYNFKTRKLGDAINDYNNAEYYKADKGVAQIRLGELYSKINNLRESEKAFKAAIVANPKSIIVYKKMGDMYYSFAQYAKAKEAYTTYLNRVQGTAEEKEKYALILFFNKDYEESNRIIDEISAQNPDNAVLYRVRAYGAYEEGKYAEGLEAIKKLFEIQKPEKIIALDYNYYGKLMLATGDTLKAAENYIKAYELDSARVADMEEAANLYAKRKDYEKSIAIYTRLQQNPTQDKSSSAYTIGREYYYYATDLAGGNEEQKALSLVKYASADSCFAVVNELSPRYTLGYLWKGRAATAVDPEAKTEEAKKAYEAALTLLLSSAKPEENYIIECYQYLASYYYFQYDRAVHGSETRSSNKNMSIEYFEKILTVRPEDQRSMDAIRMLKSSN